MNDFSPVAEGNQRWNLIYCTKCSVPRLGSLGRDKGGLWGGYKALLRDWLGITEQLPTAPVLIRAGLSSERRCSPQRDDTVRSRQSAGFLSLSSPHCAVWKDPSLWLRHASSFASLPVWIELRRRGEGEPHSLWRSEAVKSTRRRILWEF